MGNDVIGAAAAPSPEPQSISYENLEIGNPIESGGTSTVYHATTPDGTRIALKQPRVEGTMTTETATRIDTEAQTWAEIADHPHVVGLVDWATEPIPWIAMEYMDGGSLADRLEDGRLPLDSIRRIGQQICAAIRYAHRHGIVHLDLKPANLLFRETDGDPVVKVADWGLARSLREQDELVEGLTPEYAAPEQIEPDEYGQPDDFTDIYQLGAVLYEAVTGSPPFERSGVELMQAVVDERPTPPTAIDSALPGEFDEILLRALAKEKADRYETIVDFQRALGDTADTNTRSGHRHQRDESVPRTETSETETHSQGATTGDHSTNSIVDDTDYGLVMRHDSDIDRYVIKLIETGEDIPVGADQVSDDRLLKSLRGPRLAPGDPVELDIVEMDGECEITEVRPTDETVGTPMEGLVMNHFEYDTDSDTYDIKLVETGETVSVSAAQVVGTPNLKDPVEVAIVEIDDTLFATEVRVF